VRNEIRGTRCQGCGHSYLDQQLDDGYCTSCCAPAPARLEPEPPVSRPYTPPPPKAPLRAISAAAAVSRTASGRNAHRLRVDDGGVSMRRWNETKPKPKKP